MKSKGILRVPNRGLTNLLKKAVRNVFDIFRHLIRIHTYEVTWQCIQNEILLNFHSFFYDRVHRLSGGFITKLFEQLNRKLLVKTFIPGDEFITEAETGHETPLSLANK